MSDTTNSQAAAPTIAELEADIAERRVHLSTTIDELVTRVSPREIVRREVEAAKIKFTETTRTPDGQIRTEIVAGALGVTAVVLIAAGLIRRSRR